MISQKYLDERHDLMFKPWITVVFKYYFSNFLGVISFCSKIMEILTISLFYPFKFYDFSFFWLLGIRCLSPSRVSVSGTLWAPTLEPQGSHLVHLPRNFPFWGPIWSLLARFGLLLAPLVILWLPLVPLGFLLASLWHLLLPTFGSSAAHWSGNLP